MRARRWLGGLGSKRTRIASVALCEGKRPPLVTRCGIVMVERRAVRLVRDYKQGEQGGETMDEVPPLLSRPPRSAPRCGESAAQIRRLPISATER